MTTEAQAKFITDLANRILAVDLSALPTKAKAAYPARYTFNPRQNAEAAQVQAREALDGLAAGRFGIDGRVRASQIIDGLKVAARRAGC